MNYLVKETSIVIVTYNNEDEIEACINSIYSNSNSEPEIIIVDNNSRDNTKELIKSKFPKVRLFSQDENLGFGTGVNLGVEEATGKFLVVLNPDTVVKNDWLKYLLDPLEKDNKVITTPKIVLKENPEIINACGNHLHFTGLAFANGIGKKADSFKKIQEVPGISGCCFALRKKDWENLNGFDERFFLYHEDTDLSWRARKKGYSIILTPKSIVKHDFHMDVTIEKLYYLERNRRFLIKKHFSNNFILKILPSLLLTHVIALGWGFNKGVKGIRKILESYIYNFDKDILDEKVGNKNNIFQYFSPDIPENQIMEDLNHGKIRLTLNKFYRINYKNIDENGGEDET